jgi:hypothetical protein
MVKSVASREFSRDLNDALTWAVRMRAAEVSPSLEE